MPKRETPRRVHIILCVLVSLALAACSDQPTQDSSSTNSPLGMGDADSDRVSDVVGANPPVVNALPPAPDPVIGADTGSNPISQPPLVTPLPPGGDPTLVPPVTDDPPGQAPVDEPPDGASVDDPADVSDDDQNPAGNSPDPIVLARPLENWLGYTNVGMLDDFASGGLTNDPSGLPWQIEETFDAQVWESGGRVVFDSVGSSDDVAAIQSPIDDGYNFFMQPVTLSLDGLEFAGSAQARQKILNVILASTPDGAVDAADALQLSVSDAGDVRLAYKTNAPGIPVDQQQVLVDEPLDGEPPAAVVLSLDQTSYVLHVTSTQGQVYRFSGFHGIPVTHWGPRGDSALRLEGLRDVDPSVASSGASNARIEIDGLALSSSPLFDAFENGFVTDSGSRRQAWQVHEGAGGQIEEVHGRLRMTSSAGSANPSMRLVAPISRHMNFFAQQLGVEGHVTFAEGTAPAATTRARVALTSSDQTAYAADDAFVLEATDAGDLKLWAKTQASYTGASGHSTMVDDQLPAPMSGYRLLLSKSSFELRVTYPGGQRSYEILSISYS